jgi:zinc and cadmium transporter
MYAFPLNMISLPYIFGSVLVVSAISQVGILFFAKGRPRQWLMFSLVSFAAGGLLGNVFLHILPELVEEEVEAFPTNSLWIAGGILLSFVLEKVIRWRHCHSTDCHEHEGVAGLMLLIGDAAHNMLDGILIASSYLASTEIGIATTLAVILHEIPQEIGDYAVLIHSGYSKARAAWLNLLTALTALGGALLVILLQSPIPHLEHYLLPIVAGNFLYIAVADLLPELHKQTRIADAVLQLLWMLAGLALVGSIAFAE